MKKFNKIMLFLMAMVLLTSCSANRFEASERIKSPENYLPPLEGKWSVEYYIDSPYNKGGLNVTKSLIGKEALFHKDAIVVGDDFILEPTFKLKNVELSDYLLYKYKINPKDINLDGEKVQVLTIYNNNQFFYEFIKYSEDEMITFVEDRFYILKKNVDQISKEEIDRYINIEKNIKRISNIEEVDTLRTGILLGIKSYYYDEETKTDNWDYKTLWIRFNNRQLSSAYIIEDLLVPRRKGFWNVDVKRENNNDKVEAIQKTKISEDLVDMTDLELGRLYTMMESNSKILKNILYVGNDYISTEVIDLSNNKKTLQVYPIDYLEEEKAINISDIIGLDGLKLFKEGAQSTAKNLSNVYLDEENFGLSRRNGYWILKGRINYQSNGEEHFNDFNIKAIPPKELVNYDELSISWNKIKSRVPDAIDAFTSPNDDIIIIVTRNNLLIYSIIDNEISQKELGKIKIDNSQSIIMAEWGLGRYSMLWEEEVLKSDSAVSVEY